LTGVRRTLRPGTSSEGETGKNQDKRSYSPHSICIDPIGKNLKSTPYTAAVRFVTWNIDGLNERALDERTEAAVFTSILGARLDQLQSGKAKPSLPPDVIVFQEIVAHTFTAHISQHLPAGDFSVLPTEAPDRQVFEVVAFREPYVLRAYEQVPLVNSEYGRILHIVDLTDGAGKDVRVLTGHFDSGKDSGKIRTAQLKQIAEHLLSGVPSVFGGDANMRKAEWEAQRDKVGIVDTWEALGELSATRYTWQRDEYKARFDRVFTSPGFKARSMGALGVEKLPGLDATISDHIGLVVELELE
jgi:endonuclease/exonuclease/phosphatase family metal-dependent hydrolase